MQPLRTKGERCAEIKRTKRETNEKEKKDKIYFKKFVKLKSPSIFATASESNYSSNCGKEKEEALQ